MITDYMLERLLRSCPACGAARTRLYLWRPGRRTAADYKCGARYVVKDGYVEAATMCERGIETVIRLTQEEARGV